MKIGIAKFSLSLNLLIFCFCLKAFAQPASQIDSLKTAINKEHNQVTKINLYFQITNQYKNINADSAIFFNKLALEKAVALKIDTLIAQGYYHTSAIEAARNNYETALKYADSAFNYYQRTKNIYALAMVRNVQGGVYMVSGRNELASQMYFDAIRFTQDDTASATILFTYHNLVILLNTMQKHSLALEYAMKQYQWAKRIKEDDEIAYACANITDTYTELDNFHLAKPYILQLNKVAVKTKDPYIKVMAKNYSGILYYHQNQFSKAVSNYLESLRLNGGLVDQQLGCNTLINLGNAYQKLNLYDKADSCFNKAIEITTSIDVKEERKVAYEQLAQNATLQNDYKKAYYFMSLFHKLSDSLLNEKSQQAFLDAESKYKFDENKKQIVLLNAEKKVQAANTYSQRLTKNIIIASAILLFIMGALFFNRFQLKKKIESQQALLKERRRISRDLHDDLGSTLSSVKAYSEILKDNPDNPLITELLKENATEMIDRLEVIAWATNPQQDSFASFINKINRYAAPACSAKNIEYNSYSDGIPGETMMPGEIRQNLYFVAKEAINNTIKYSNGTNCTVRSSLHNRKLIMDITDNGDGFDSTSKQTGNGLQNMRSRIEEIGGELTIISSPVKGTQIKVEIDLSV